jgi:hypothetical protein
MKHFLHKLICKYGEDWEGWFIIRIFNYEILAGWSEDSYGNPQEECILFVKVK